MQNLSRSTVAVATVASALALAVGPVDAQEVPEAAACTAQVSPVEVPSGSAATELTVTLPDAPGPLTGVEAAPSSGIALASPGDLPRSEMAAEEAEEAPRPIAMGESANSWTIWLNTANATPGRYQLTFETGMATCRGEVIIG